MFPDLSYNCVVWQKNFYVQLNLFLQGFQSHLMAFLSRWLDLQKQLVNPILCWEFLCQASVFKGKNEPWSSISFGSFKVFSHLARVEQLLWNRERYEAKKKTRALHDGTLSHVHSGHQFTEECHGEDQETKGQISPTRCSCSMFVFFPR